MLVPIPSERLADTQTDPNTEWRLRKEAQKADESRVLDPWERYRALSDHYDSVLGVSEIYDKKTRFALVILGGLNALNVILTTRVDMFKPLAYGGGMMRGYAACYALLSLYFLAYAISALKPRIPPAAGADQNGGRGMLGLLPNLGTRRPSLDDFCNNWRQVPIGELNRELAVLAYSINESNDAKLQALHRVFVGLYVLAGLTAAIVVFLSLSIPLP